MVSLLLKIKNKIGFFIAFIIQTKNWYKRSFNNPVPDFIKRKYLIGTLKNKNSAWIETGTFVGKTTIFLSNNSQYVISLEPSEECYLRAKENTKYIKNILLINQNSEKGLKNAIDIMVNKYDGDHIGFWLDGHYSGGITFKNQSICPLKEELEIIFNAINKGDLPYKNIYIFIDDIRLCIGSSTKEEKSYPSLDYLSQQLSDYGFSISIANDILTAIKINEK